MGIFHPMLTPTILSWDKQCFGMISPIKEINPLLPYVISYPIRENISNIMVCHTQRLFTSCFQGCLSAYCKKVSPYASHPPGLVREAPPHAKGTTPSKYLGLQTDGEFVKGSACWPQQPPSLQICQRRRSKWLVSLNRGSTNSCSSGNAGPV